MSASWPPLRLGIAGLGRAFTLMLPTLTGDARVRVVAACDPRKTARAQFTRDFDAPAFDSIEALAAQSDVEAIYVASPHQFHAEHTRTAAAAGKHVLVEKPMALTRAECDAMIDSCERAGVVLIVGHCHSFDMPYLETRHIVASGELGRVRMVQALNYTDFLYRPRRPEELRTEDGGGVVFSQAAHQVDVVRLVAGSRVIRVRSVLGRWDEARPTEGAYAALLWFSDGAFATIAYSGYGHFDSDEWCGGIGEMGQEKQPSSHGAARRRLATIASSADEARLKAAGTYGGADYRAAVGAPPPFHQHFGPLIVSCERGVVRPLPDAVWVQGDLQRERRALPAPVVPRFEVIDELVSAVRDGQPPLHDGAWARATLDVCLALLQSAHEQRDVELPP